MELDFNLHLSNFTLRLDIFSDVYCWSYLFVNGLFVFTNILYEAVLLFPIDLSKVLRQASNSLIIVCVANILSNLAFVFFMTYFLPYGCFTCLLTNSSIFSCGFWVLGHVLKGLPQLKIIKCLLTLCPCILGFYVLHLSIFI